MKYYLRLILIAVFLLGLVPSWAQTPDETLIYPENFSYRGAFRLPADPAEGMGWEYGGAAMAYYPDGDSTSSDAYPGSLFATGHAYHQYVAEIAIPEPVISPDKNVEDLPTANILQDFQDIRGGLYDFENFELPRVGLAYLPAQGEQTSGKLYFAWGQHYEDNPVPTHGWAETDLSNPQTAGLWHISTYSNYTVNDYLFLIDPAWADENLGGMLLATGRFRDGGWSGQGPSLIAFAPWWAGNPPAPNSILSAEPLLLYGSSEEGSTLMMDNYHHSDEWNGGAWLGLDDKSAVIFAGTKGIGEYWYGFANGVIWPDEPPYPDIPPYPNDDRGWWSTSFAGQIIFYNPADLAAVARGELAAHEPQPYASFNIDDYLFNVQSPQQKYRVGAIAYDRANNLLYMFELFGDGDLPLVHVWHIE